MHHSTLSPLWVFAFPFVVSIPLIIWAILSRRKRKQELSEAAQQLGFTFMGNAWHGPTLDPQHKTCLLQRTGGRFSNVMVGMAGGLETIVFDYTYSAGKSTVRQTLVCFSQKAQLPPFTLKPEGLFDRIGDAFVHNDIDFASNPVFSERYTLKSPDEQATRRLFTPSLLTSMEQIPSDKHWFIDASATNLFFYRPSITIRPTKLAACLQETSMIARTIFSSDGLKNLAF